MAEVEVKGMIKGRRGKENDLSTFNKTWSLGHVFGRSDHFAHTKENAHWQNKKMNIEINQTYGNYLQRRKRKRIMRTV